MQFPERPTIYLDVSHMLGNRQQTGIQRVVRNLARVGPGICGLFRYNCRLVHAVRDQFYRVRFDLIDPTCETLGAKLLRRRWGRSVYHAAVPRLTAPLIPEPNDLLITLNATWDLKHWQAALAKMSQQCFVASVIYDLIPLTHPQFHEAELCRRFESWLAQLCQTSHHLCGISRHCQTEIMAYLQKRSLLKAGHHREQAPSVSHFRLGTQFSTPSPDAEVNHSALRHAVTPSWHTDSAIRPNLREFLEPGGTQNLRCTRLLSVGTVEPRKNHELLLSACLKLWQSDWDGRLLLIGKSGWKNHQTVATIRSIAADRLLWIQDATDAEVDFAYQNASALVFPSWQEGFGLPLIEAFAHGLAVFASDIPVHREVAGGACAYFSPESAEELAEQISKHQRHDFLQLRQATNGFQHLSWEQSFRLLLCDAIVAQQKYRTQGQPFSVDRSGVKEMQIQRAA